MKPFVLIILDGWGLAPPGPGNAISQAKLVNIPHFWSSYPHTQLTASGMAVGLPPGEDGNTETGHLNIGAGRIVYQDLLRINQSIDDGSFFRNKAFEDAVSYANSRHSNIHLLGLMSDSAVHANINHLVALLELIKRQNCSCPVYIHVFTDGRDSPPKSSKRFLTKIQDACQELGIGVIASIIGRYYAMDRDLRWERTQLAYEALTQNIDRVAPSAEAAIDQAYAEGKTDEFLDPTIILNKNGVPYPRIKDGDSVVMYNFRIDRPRQFTRALVLPDFEQHALPQSFDPYAVKYFHKHIIDVPVRSKPFTRSVVLSHLFVVTMTEYEKNLPVSSAFPPIPVATPIGKVFSDHNLQQLHVSESEKERFITYYFNGLREEPFGGEDRLIVPSPKVATYDLCPQMSAYTVTQKLLDMLSTGKYAFAVVNFANPDMVGHTGNIRAAIEACEVVDRCVGDIVTKTLEMGGACFITADHGNVEEMLTSDGSMDTEHSLFPVPFMVIHSRFQGYPLKLPPGKLSDIAPTILSYAGIPIPNEMTGQNLMADVQI
ncbi:2,3-bisphosphoglycerate-independent phosphoglycerate mutase [Patescibacteria group bacterium]|nr:2,3-bisphosphoglycerate-independent phosphoglycerate mutase [Patescibacteria group bacterium]MBU1473224.1 2,3-bisphosphoglycerate-independent phosphoglycerate mutase [Patescibacteria group bacterium]MBU2459918.1 2,3-bisphosphoglycerate-independent phosphoglycerate mutase [Patescibacteria group bacterium]MBU2544139.1 2,3-bisphosphoglycerate-independent phosphoglycerate mutase [Patescibacteria group bacterium]